jgi:hypothetical protein
MAGKVGGRRMRVNPVERDEIEYRCASGVSRSPRSPGHAIRVGASSLRHMPICDNNSLSGSGRTSMNRINRRSALKIGVAAASAAVVKPVAAQTTGPLQGRIRAPGQAWLSAPMARVLPSSLASRPSRCATSSCNRGQRPWVRQCRTRWCAIFSKARCGSIRKVRPLPRRRTSAGPATKTQRSKRLMTATSSLLCESRI